MPMIEQTYWRDIFDESAYTLSTICLILGMDKGQFVDYLECNHKPRKKNQERMEKAMIELMKEKKLTRHPSYGYATEEQIKQLNELGIGPTRDAVMAQIEKQNKNKGKFK